MHESEDRPEEQSPERDSGAADEPDDATGPTPPEDAADSEQPGDPEDPEDAAWREIVANFGDRVSLDESEVVRPAPAEPEPEPEPKPAEPEKGWFAIEPIDLDGPARYEPPPPPPLPRPKPDRLFAWLGVLGVPVLTVLLVIIQQATGFDVPDWATVLLVLGFLGGFGYLIATMPRDRDDPWDDGAQV